MRATEQDWRRLASKVIERRNELGLTQEDVRAAGGPSTATMRLVEGALQDSYKDASLARLERALQWRVGSIDRILQGLDPITARQDATATPATVEAKAIVASGPTPGRMPDHLRSTEDILREIAEIESRMTPEELARVNRDIAEEEAELARVLAARRLRYARLMRGEPPIPD